MIYSKIPVIIGAGGMLGCSTYTLTQIFAVHSTHMHVYTRTHCSYCVCVCLCMCVFVIIYSNEHQSSIKLYERDHQPTPVYRA